MIVSIWIVIKFNSYKNVFKTRNLLYAAFFCTYTSCGVNKMILSQQKNKLLHYVSQHYTKQGSFQIDIIFKQCRYNWTHTIMFMLSRVALNHSKKDLMFFLITLFHSLNILSICIKINICFKNPNVYISHTYCYKKKQQFLNLFQNYLK